MDNRTDESPTTFAAKLISEGHSPDEVKQIMEKRNMSYPTVANVLDEFMSKKNRSVEDIAQASGINAAMINRIMNEQRNPSRNILLRIAMALGLSVEETQVLLKSGNCAPLSASRERDLIIMDAIINGKNYDSVNESLETKNMPVLKESYKYYAFISYSHKDKEIAQKLQKRLEEYHLPSALLKSKPDLPDKLSPIFMDESNLVATGTLKEALQKNLDSSKYLIVICSPNSAKSEYVNDEVEYFIRKGRVGNIIPLIIDGLPHAENPDEECFPGSILKLPREQELLGIDMKKFGEREAFLRVIATMLQLDLDEFVSRDVQIRKKKMIIFALIAAVLAVLAGLLVWYNIGFFIGPFNEAMMKARNGDVHAQYIVGNMYFGGSYVEVNKTEAVKWYQKAADGGDADAQLSLGLAYSMGAGVSQDKAESVKWYLKSAEQGNTTAQFMLANAYFWGNDGVDADRTEAVKWYRAAAEQGDFMSQYYLGEAYISGEGVSQDYTEAAKWLQSAIDQGYTTARTSLDFVLKCQNAEKGDALSQYEVGRKYADEHKYSKASMWYRKSAEQEYMPAQYELGNIMYSGGFGIERNYEEAVKWWSRASELGNVEALDKLCFMYYVGNGVEKNSPEALEWYRKAVDKGIVRAQFYLGSAYFYGKGIKQNKIAGLEFWRKAAEQGDTQAAELYQKNADKQ